VIARGDLSGRRQARYSPPSASGRIQADKYQLRAFVVKLPRSLSLQGAPGASGSVLRGEGRALRMLIE
jgi:hypothetical protein